jgi:hypothetical protein
MSCTDAVISLTLPRAPPEKNLLHALSTYKIGGMDKIQKKGFEALDRKRKK